MPDTFGQYQILSPLGKGGMGEVFLARDTVLKRDVALKVLPDAFARDPERSARFRREAEVLASLNHPGIAQIYGLAESDGRRAIAMEHVSGPALTCPLPIDTALDYARQMIEALEYAHDRGIVHRDLKPANVRISADGAVKLLDFGLAKVAADPASPLDPDHSPTLTLGHTTAGQILGTPAYMAPEQITGRAADRRSDIFAFGALLYEMLTGARVFEGTSVEDTLASVLKLDPDWSKLPADVPAGVRALLVRCLHKDRRLRLQAIGEARIALANLDAEPASRVKATRPSRLRYAWPTAAAVLFLALAGVAAVHYRETPPEPSLFSYTIPLPENSNPNAMALSPDGRLLAVTARSSGLLTSLWVRDLETLETRLLIDGPDAGSSASAPAWSPDGRSIIYVGVDLVGRVRQLRRIAAAGGPPEVIATSELLADNGSSVDASGRVLVGSNGRGVVLVESGRARLIRPRKPDALVRYPEFVQDGRRFLYSVTTGPTERIGIYLAALDGNADGSEDRRIFPDASTMRYVPPAAGETNGRLFFVRGETLVAQPVDPESFAPAGEAVPVAAGLRGAVGGISNFAFTVTQGGVLAHLTGGDRENKDITWYDRTGKPGATLIEGRIVGLALARDGRRLAVSQVRGDQLPAVWLRDVASGTESRLTGDSAVHYYAVWAPDGSRVAFSSTRTGNLDLYEKVLTSAESDRLIARQDNRPMYAYDWTRDGRHVLFGTGLQLFAASASGTQIPLTSGGFSRHGQLSPPDDRWLASSTLVGGLNEVSVQPFSLDEKPPSQRWQISSGGGTEPRWSRDGRELFYISADQQLMSVRVRPGLGAAFEWNPPTALFPMPPGGEGEIVHFRYEVAPDGRFLILRNRPGAAPPSATIVTNWRRAIVRRD